MSVHIQMPIRFSSLTPEGLMKSVDITKTNQHHVRLSFIKGFHNPWKPIGIHKEVIFKYCRDNIKDVLGPLIRILPAAVGLDCFLDIWVLP